MSTFAVSMRTPPFVGTLFRRRPLSPGQVRAVREAGQSGDSRQSPRGDTANAARGIARLSRVDDAGADRVADEAGDLVNPELLHEARPVRLRRLRRDAEELRHRTSRLPLRHELEHLALARGQRVDRDVVTAEGGLYDGARHAWRKIALAASHRVDRLHEIVRGLRLQHLAVRARL